MKLEITIEMDNEAFGEFTTIEVVRILKDTSEKIDRIGLVGDMTLRDCNGNRVGQLQILT
jgi:hypothetical protein